MTTRPAADHGLESDECVGLVARMSAGDCEALAQFYERWSRSVYALVSQIVSDPDCAEDVVEDIFYCAWRRASQYDASHGAVSTWIATMARGRALDCVRSRRRQGHGPLTPVLALDDLVEATRLDLAGHIPVSEQRARVAAAVRSMPCDQRQVFELAYYRGLSQRSIADQIGQTLDSVKTRVRLAGQKLRERLVAEPDDVPRARVEYRAWLAVGEDPKHRETREEPSPRG